MILNPSIFKAYDVRAVYPKEVDPEGWINVVKGTYTYLLNTQKSKRLIVNVSHDMRDGSRELYEVTIKELVKLGAEVNALGLASTPHSYLPCYIFMPMQACRSLPHTIQVDIPG